MPETEIELDTASFDPFSCRWRGIILTVPMAMNEDSLEKAVWTDGDFDSMG